MAEISVQFKNKINGYDKVEVQEYAKRMEADLQTKSMALANAEQKIEELEARLNKIVRVVIKNKYGEDVTANYKITTVSGVLTVLDNTNLDDLK